MKNKDLIQTEEISVVPVGGGGGVPVAPVVPVGPLPVGGDLQVQGYISTNTLALPNSYAAGTVTTNGTIGVGGGATPTATGTTTSVGTYTISTSQMHIPTPQFKSKVTLKHRVERKIPRYHERPENTLGRKQALHHAPNMVGTNSYSGELMITPSIIVKSGTS